MSSTFGTVLILVLVPLLLGMLPVWPHSGSWGYYPSGGMGCVLVVLPHCCYLDGCEFPCRAGPDPLPTQNMQEALS